MKVLFKVMVALAIAWGAVVAQAKVETPKLTLIHIPISNFLTAYVAKDKGFFAAHGLDVTLTQINQGNTAVAGIVSNSADISTPTPTTFLQAVDSGIDLKVIALTHTYPTPNKVGLLVSPTSAIRQSKDLSGKKIGLNGIGGMQHVLLMQWLTDHGVSPKAVTFVEIGFPQMADALKSDHVDAVTISEPFYQRVIAAKLGVLLADLQADIPADTAGTIYVATGEWVKKNPGTIAEFRAALEDATSFIKANPDVAKQTLLAHTNIAKALLELVHVPNVSVAVRPSQLEYWIKLMKGQGLISGKVDAASVVAP